MNARRITLLLAALLLAIAPLHADETYQRPPKEILDVLDAPPFPVTFVSPTGDTLLLGTQLRYPPISDLAEPQLRLAGVRINPRTNGIHGAFYFVKYALKKLPDGTEVPVELPSGARVSTARWNPNGKSFIFTNITNSGWELWLCDVATAKIHRIDGIQLNPILGVPYNWLADQKTLLVRMVPANRPAPPADIAAPPGPRVQESNAVAAASSTYEARDLLRNPHDADLFEYYTTSQLALVDTSTGAIAKIGAPAIYTYAAPSPSGKYLLVQHVHRPFSYLRPYDRFPLEVEVWDTTGAKVQTLASLPLAEQVPINGERTGPRDHFWRPTAPATLLWAEALDEGDTYKKVPFHDKVMLQPVGGDAVELCKLEHRYAGVQFIEHGGLLFMNDYDMVRHWYTTTLLDADHRDVAPRVVWNLSSDDLYGDPGNPIFHTMPNGAAAVREDRGRIFMSGQGASPEGNRPFLDRLDLKTLKTERLFRSASDSLESVVDIIDPAAPTFLTRKQSPSDPPNIYLRTMSANRAITHFTDPTPQLRQITKRLVTYQRPDGVKLSFTLYLPPGYKEGTRLPTIVWAYPLDYTDPSAAGQVAASPQEFTQLVYASPVFLALEGYAVLNDTAMPVVGPTETAYDTFIEQIVANAKAAIDKAVELGVTDRDRVGVAGHSHGALMTANLLAWSDLFRAGVARSGAYNHTLRPFGFQNEHRTLYKAMDTYLKLSPLLHANQINEPLLIIHGELDANPGTVPLQSEKLFEAIRGVGGRARYVVLPLESHGYVARESVEQTLYEMVSWFDKYVKNAGPR